MLVVGPTKTWRRAGGVRPVVATRKEKTHERYRERERGGRGGEDEAVEVARAGRRSGTRPAAGVGGRRRMLGRRRSQVTRHSLVLLARVANSR